MYKLIKYSDNYSEKSGSLWKYCKYKPALDVNNVITGFTVTNSFTYSFEI